MQIPRLPAHSSRRIREELLPWFVRHARNLPWRENRTPYRVWISETMLQQTRVETVIPYFLRWMKTFPTLTQLAEAEQEQVLKLWEGLGYYARARNLHAAARQICRDHGGEFPADPLAVSRLPGVGPYTLAAVMSLAFDLPYAVLDGNVERVLTRYCACAGDIRRPAVKEMLRGLAKRLLARHPPGMFNEAMMELGATVCLPRAPRCGDCPLSAGCRAFRRGEAERYPVKSARGPVPVVEVGAAVVWRDATHFLVARRRENGMLGGLWEFPGGKREPGESMRDCVRRELLEELGIQIQPGPEWIRVRHSYTHFHLRMGVHQARWEGDPPRAIECADFRWVTRAQCRELPFSGADLKVLAALDAAPAPAAELGEFLSSG